MPSSSWLSWRRSAVACKSHEPGEVHDPQTPPAPNKDDPVFGSRRICRSVCSRSISSLRDVIHGSRRISIAMAASSCNLGVPSRTSTTTSSNYVPNLSPKSVESNDFVQSISPEAMLRDCAVYDTRRRPQGLRHPHHRPQLHHGKLSLDDIVAEHHHRNLQSSHPRDCKGSRHVLKSSNNANVCSSSFYGTPLHQHAYKVATNLHNSSDKAGVTNMKKFSGCYDCRNPSSSLVLYASNGRSPSGCTNVPAVVHARPLCQKCGEVFSTYDSLEEHHFCKHAVTELDIGDSSRNVVEIIFKTSWLRPCNNNPNDLMIERVLKVNHLKRRIASFERYREGVKVRASKLSHRKHPRCLADGNELLRFYPAALECVLAHSPCRSLSCHVCRIICSGFPKLLRSASDQINGGASAAYNTSQNCKGILTTATSGRAHQLLLSSWPRGKENSHSSDRFGRHINEPRAMLLCRVIAGRVHRPPRSSGEVGPPSAGFDSIAGGDAAAAGGSGGDAPSDAAGLRSRFEELTVFSPRAILPCFVVLYRC